MKSLKSFLHNQYNDSDKGVVSNTPLNSQISETPFTYRVDTLTLIFDDIATKIEFDDLLTAVAATFGDDIVLIPDGNSFCGNRKWDEVYRGNYGVIIHRDRPRGCIPGKVRLHLAGLTLSRNSFRAFIDCVIPFATAYQGRATRFDGAVDDHNAQTKMDDIWNAYQMDHNRGFSKASRYYDPKHGDDTIYLGKQGTRKYVRVYNKTIESKGKIKGIRWELQLREKEAERAFNHFLHAAKQGVEQGYRAIASLVFGAVDFAHKKDKNCSRDTRLDWYQQLMNATYYAPLRLPPIKRTFSVHKSVSWSQRQWKKVAGGLKRMLGNEFNSYIHMLAEEGNERMTDQEKRAWDSAPLTVLCT